MEEKELDLDLDFRDLIYDYENRVPRVQEIKARRIKNSFTPTASLVGVVCAEREKTKKFQPFLKLAGHFRGFYSRNQKEAAKLRTLE